MPRHLPPVRRIACAVLTLWLGLWPAADAVTGASWTVIVEPATEQAGARCPLPASIIDGSAAPECCPLSNRTDSPDSGCCEAKQSRCCRCFSLGGMVLFAVAQWTLDADQVVRGTVSAAGMDAPSRHLQPPVPPPWAAS
jgi:hypothetical protein